MEFPNEIESEDDDRDTSSRDLCLEYIRKALNSVSDNPSEEDSDTDSEKKIDNKLGNSSLVIFQQGIDRNRQNSALFHLCSIYAT